MAERGVIFKDDFVTAPDKSWFDMSFDFLLSGNFGELIPTTCMECMPEDKIHAKSDSFVRLAPLVSPTFGKVNMFDYHFYVRNRSIWTQWESFIADKDQRKSWQQANPLWTPPEIPYIDVREVLFNSKLFYVDLTSKAIELKVTDSGHDSILRSTLYGFNDLGVNYLVVRYAYADELNTYSAYITNRIEELDFNGVEEQFIFPFIPNKNENSGILSTVYYNPFSNGTLFDYLGVDLSGVYSQIFTLIRDNVHTLEPDFNFDDILPAYVHDVHLTDAEMRIIEPVSLILSEFIRSHAVLGFAYAKVASGSYYGYVNDFRGNIKTVEKDAINDYLVTDTPDSTIIYVDNETSKINALPLRAYHSIYIDYFRDQNYISVNPCIDFSRDGNDIDWTQSGGLIFDYLTLNYKAYEHDPYTSALPQAQRGEPVRYLPDANLKFEDATVYTGDTYQVLRAGTGGSVEGKLFGSFATDTAVTSNFNTKVFTVDLSAATIENLRFANALQKLKEREARSGGRYFELMEAIFGARIDDAKIDRPIFLGGDKTPIQVSEVLQTSATEVNSDQPLGQMAGRAVAIGNDDFIEYVTPDHGFFIEICAVLPRTNYQQGLLPMFTRKVRLDYPMPQFAQLGETQVPQSELWYSADEVEDKKPFGYQSRYYDSKYQRDRTSGTFKDALAHWTWSRIFDNAPVAGKTFIEVHPDYRQFAVTDKAQEHLYIHMWHDIQVLRALPVFGTPKL